jgi:ferredoxin
VTQGSPRTHGEASEFVGLKEWRLTIDRIKCDGHGLCAELLPELIRVDDWGYPIITPGSVPERLVPLAQHAVTTCPVMALALQRVEKPR